MSRRGRDISEGKAALRGWEDPSAASCPSAADNTAPIPGTS